jgi:small subunit ribosomal protein S1
LTDETDQETPQADPAEAAAAQEQPADDAQPAAAVAASPADDSVDPEVSPAEASADEAADASGRVAIAVADEPGASDEPAAPQEAVAPEPPSPAESAQAVVEEIEAPDLNGSVPDDEPMTMAELLDNPENEVKSLKHGDVVEGTVVRIDPDEILIDFGGKSEGVVSNRELISRRGPRDGDEQRAELKMGDEVLVYVLQPESPEGHAVLSLRRAGLERKWRAMQERFDAGEIVEAKVIDHNKGGLIVDLGVRGFVPISQIVDFPRRPRDEQPRDAAQEIAEKLQPFVGRTLRLKILEVNRKANRLILSEKVALYEERREKRDELFSSLQVGQKVQGQVRSIAPFGVFVDLGGIDGLVHKSELSWNKVNNPETAYQIGDEVEAEVIDINHERGRISLSIRRLQPDPWQESVAKYKIGDVIEGTVTKLVNFGAFVRVEEGLEGLIHISELSNQRVAHPGDVVKEGEAVNLKIISLDSERHRLGLSLKQAEERSTVDSAPAATSRFEQAPRRDGPQRRERREQFRSEDATREPEGGIDNTMAAAFAESGLLEQFRASQAERDEEETASDASQASGDGEASAAAAEVAEPDAPAADEVAVPADASSLAEAATDADATAEAAVAAPEAEAAEPEVETEAVVAEPEPAPSAEPTEVEAPQTDNTIVGEAEAASGEPTEEEAKA